LYARSVARPAFTDPARSMSGPEGGSFYLISQSAYLRGIDCDAAEIILICTE